MYIDQPDIILSDVMMPVMGGFELLQALRQDNRTCHIPVILLSARAGEEAKIEGLQVIRKGEYEASIHLILWHAGRGFRLSCKTIQCKGVHGTSDKAT